MEKQRHENLKRAVLGHYGNGVVACVKCGFTDLRALSIDHIKAGGTEHRRRLRSSSAFYKWLKDNGYPIGYQTLCMNCQFIKRFENNENNLSAAQRRERNIKRFENELKEPIPLSAKSIRRKINHMQHLRFKLKQLYEIYDANDETQKLLIRTSVYRMCKRKQIIKLGSGLYERVVDGVNRTITSVT